MSDCPHTERVGYVAAKLQELEGRISLLEMQARTNADDILVGKTEVRLRNIWLDRIARLIGYLILAGALIAAGKVTGLAELIIKVFSFKWG